MPYAINLSGDGKYIILTIKGEINRKIAMPQNLEAHELGRNLGISRYLVDVTEARNTDSILDQHDFAYKDMQENKGIDRSARVAALISPSDHSHDFIETVAKNSGFNLRLFNDRKKAERFLLD